MTKSANFLLALSVVGGAIISPQGVIANPVQTVRIVYSDLNLENRKDIRLLGRRITLALDKVCGSYAGVTEMNETNRIYKCRTAARQQVAPQLARLMKLTGTRLSSARAGL